MKRLLIVKMSSIGDVLHALPVVKSIKSDLPELSIGWVVRERCANLLKGAEFIDNVHVISDVPLLDDLLTLRKELHKQKYDTVFDMQGLVLSGLITAFSGARRRVGLNRNREMNAVFLTEATIEGKAPNMHAVDVQLGFRNAAGLGPISDLPSLTHLGRESAGWLLSLNALFMNKSVVVLNVGASTIYKRWPNDSWAKLAKLFVNNGTHVVLTAGPSEAQDARSIAAEIDNVLSVTDLGGKTTQDQLAAILGRCDLTISGDTGPMHLSAAVGTPTLALFGPTDPRLTGPYGRDNKTIWKQISCSPCFRHPTCAGRVDCLKAISADEVFLVSQQMLSVQPRGLVH